MIRRRVVITGYGAVSPLGNDVDTLWNNVKQGKSGIKQIRASGYEEINTRIGEITDDFKPEKCWEKKEFGKYNLFIQYACAAAKQALNQANLNTTAGDSTRLSVYIGSEIGCLSTVLENHELLLEKDPGNVSPFVIPMMISKMAAGIVAIKTGFKGPSFSPVSSCVNSNQAIGEAFLNILHGYSDAILAGGAEASIHPLAYAEYVKMKAISANNDFPEKACRLFVDQHDGFIMSEGAGILLLEEYEHAKNRGATILVEIIGYGSTTDSYDMTSPDYNGAVRAIKSALRMADLEPMKIDFINAHGISTSEGDKSETNAIKTVFGPHAYRLKVSSIKSMTGRLFKAAGGLEAIITLKSLQENIIPPSINYENPDSVCNLGYLPHQGVTAKVDYALSNGSGFDGHNAVLVFKKFKDASFLND